MRIDVHHLTRVEGHGNIVVEIDEGGHLARCSLEIVEAPRFFEVLLCGRPYSQATHIASRICGICAVTHATTSLLAVEKALAVTISNQTKRLRKINLLAEILDSHILHAYMLVAPDLLGAPSVIPLARSHREVVLRALRMKKLAGDLCAAIGGRHTHPVSMLVGGFSHLPSLDELESLRARFEQMTTDVDDTVELFQALRLPAFERETEYLALHREDDYAFMGGEIISSDGGRWSPESYPEITNEFMVPHSTAKHTRHRRESYMVGALARFNLNHTQLHPRAQSAASALNLRAPCTNPYMNTVAQIVEIAHCTEKIKALLDEILQEGIHAEPPVASSTSSGEGVGASEAPRGTLYHHYRIEDGIITWANCIIPTNQNLANIEADMRSLVPMRLERKPAELRLDLEMLVRAYDPCISCSTHLVDLRYPRSKGQRS